MNFTALVVHGLSALAVFGETVSVRLLMAAVGLAAIAAVLVAAVLYVRLATSLAVPGWATYVTALLLIVILQSVLAAGIVGFVLISARSNTSFVPLRDTHYFVLETVQVYPNL